MSAFRLTALTLRSGLNSYLKNSIYLSADTSMLPNACLDYRDTLKVILSAQERIVSIDATLMKYNDNGTWAPVRTEYSVELNQVGLRSNPTQYFPAGVGLYYKLSSGVGRPSRLLIKTAMDEGDLVANGSLWYMASGGLISANTSFLNAMAASFIGNSSQLLVTLNKGSSTLNQVKSINFRWCNKYHFPRPVLIG